MRRSIPLCLLFLAVQLVDLAWSARLSCLLALATQGTVSGVIGASAGYPVVN